jgi:hypothetical protein
MFTRTPLIDQECLIVLIGDFRSVVRGRNWPVAAPLMQLVAISVSSRLGCLLLLDRNANHLRL